MREKGKVFLLCCMVLFVMLALVACSDNNSISSAASSATKAQPTSAPTNGVEMVNFVAATSAPIVTGATTITGVDGDPNKGYQVFRRSCQVCHSNGGTTEGPDGQPNLASSKNTGDPAFIVDRIRNGKAAGIIQMPAFSTTGIRDTELNDVVAYILSIKNSGFVPATPTPMPIAVAAAPTPTATIPVPPPTDTSGKVVSGSASRGETIFRQTCQRCHANGGRTRGDKDQPNLSTNTRAWNSEFVRGVITNGFGTMPTFGPNFTAQEIEDVVKYVTSINTSQKP
jgi:mono/diheme cytochrome c family protein